MAWTTSLASARHGRHILKSFQEHAAVEIAWTPGHSGAPGNEMADAAAKIAAQGITSAQENLAVFLLEKLPKSVLAMRRAHTQAHCSESALERTGPAFRGYFSRARADAAYRPRARGLYIATGIDTLSLRHRETSRMRLISSLGFENTSCKLRIIWHLKLTGFPPLGFRSSPLRSYLRVPQCGRIARMRPQRDQRGVYSIAYLSNYRPDPPEPPSHNALRDSLHL